MPTATATLTSSTAPSSFSTMAGRSSAVKAGGSSSLAALRTMYQRAARAFLQRNTTETQNLLEGAFQILTPPSSPQPDHLSSQRKKWDILRITLETTLYTSPAHSTHLRKRVPPPSPPPSSAGTLRSNLLLSPPSLLATLHTRSLRLFTPPTQKPSPAFLPAQILVSLVLASLKLECPQVGRGMIEEWLARRSPPELALLSDLSVSDDGYAKVVDVYCLHILPRLEEWEYAAEFLRYEVELSADRRSQISESLKRLHAQSQIPFTPPPPYRIKPLPATSSDYLNGSRPLSRVSSTSSTSTYTAVPATPRPTNLPKGVPEVTRKEKTSIDGTPNGAPKGSIDGEVRSPSRASTVKPGKAMALTDPPATLSLGVNLSGSSSSSPFSTGPPIDDPAHQRSSSPSSLVTRFHTHLAVIKVHYLPIFKAKLPFVICVLLPALLLLARLRKASLRGGKKTVGRGQSADELRRRLGVSGSSAAGSAVWSQAWKAIQDTVVMAGRGLV